jgi:hypothetical protein
MHSVKIVKIKQEATIKVINQGNEETYGIVLVPHLEWGQATNIKGLGVVLDHLLHH